MALEEGRFFVGSMSARRHNADGFAEYCRRFLSSGVWALDDNLNVTPAGGMAVNVSCGHALVDGYPYGVIDNDTGPLILEIEAANPDLPRIDRVIARKDITAQRVYACIKKGTPAISPEPPELDECELEFCCVAVAAGATEITADDLTDERELVQNKLNPPGPLGDVFGPESSAAGNLVAFNDASGKVIKDSGKQAADFVLKSDFVMADIVSAVKRAIYRVGDIIVTTVSTNPAADYGGTWIAWGSGRIPIGVDSGDSDFDEPEKTGGEKAHQLTAAQLPKNAYGLHLASDANTGARQTNKVCIGRDGTTLWDAGGAIYSGANDDPHNNMPPYIAVYMWKKTA